MKLTFKQALTLYLSIIYGIYMLFKIDSIWLKLGYLALLLIIFTTIEGLIKYIQELQYNYQNIEYEIHSVSAVVDMTVDSLIVQNNLTENISKHNLSYAKNSDNYIQNLRVEVRDKIFPDTEITDFRVVGITNCVLTRVLDKQRVTNDDVYFINTFKSEWRK